MLTLFMKSKTASHRATKSACGCISIFYKLDHNYKSTKHLLRMFFLLLFFIPFLVTGPRLHAFSRPPVSGSEKLKEGLFWPVWSALCSTSTFNILTPYLSFHIRVLTTLTMFTQNVNLSHRTITKNQLHTHIPCLLHNTPLTFTIKNKTKTATNKPKDIPTPRHTWLPSKLGIRSTPKPCGRTYVSWMASRCFSSM